MHAHSGCRRAAAIFCVLLLGACASTGSAPSRQLDGTAWHDDAANNGREVVTSELPALPTTFRGELPCADCEAIRHHLDLWPDHVFHLRREWLGRQLVRDELGRWRFDAARRALVLEYSAEMPLQFELLNDGRLRQLDLDGRHIESRLPYELDNAGALTPMELNLLLAGEFTYLADAARFTECITGRSYPVAFEADFVQLERAYLAHASAPGAPLHVSFEGSLVERPAFDGPGSATTVIVRRFVGAWPQQRCTR